MFFAFEVPKERDFVHFSGLGDLSGGGSVNSSSGQDKTGGVDKPFPGLIDGRAGGSEGTLGRMFHVSTYLHRWERNASGNLRPLLGWHHWGVGVSACRRAGTGSAKLQGFLVLFQAMAKVLMIKDLLRG
jgi:hypothetical protein